MRRWHVAMTKAFYGAEDFAAKGLREQKFEVYNPKTYTRALNGKRLEPVCTLRFSGYVFIRFDADAKEHGPINNTRGIDELLVSVKDVPLPLDDEIIESLRQIEDEEFAEARSKKKAEPRGDLRPGDAVMIDDPDHPARGQQGQLLAIDKRKASVLIGMCAWKVDAIGLRRIQQDPPAHKKAG